VTSPIRFQTLADLTIPALTSPPKGTVAVENSTSYLETVAASGRPNQQFTLTRAPYIDDSAVISAGNGGYTEVSSFLSSGPTDRHFTVAVDQLGKATIRFGNGVNGELPTGTITAVYKTGGGAAGNVEANKITKPIGTFEDVLGNRVVVTSTNLAAAADGADRTSMGMIKLLAPESVRVAGRTVAKEDYEINARRVTGVARALMLTSNETVSVGENMGKLFVIPLGGGTPSSVLKAAVLAMVTDPQPDGYPHTLTFHVDVLDPVYEDVDVQAVVYLAKGANAATVKAAIESNLETWFQVSNDDGTPNENVDFGANILDVNGDPDPKIAWSDIFNVVRDTTGVRKIDPGIGGFLLNGARLDVTVGLWSFPRLGTVTLINGDTGLPL
jgi:predicted phage baseplate assembly protein